MRVLQVVRGMVNVTTLLIYVISQQLLTTGYAFSPRIITQSSQYSFEIHEKKKTTKTAATIRKKKEKDITNEQLISDFCQGTNEFWETLVIPPVKNYVQFRASRTPAGSDPISKLTAPPELPGIPRPVWLTILVRE